MSLMVIDELVEKEELTKLWNINCGDITQLIQDFISNSVNDAGAEGVVIGLSGGIDSTVAVYLAAKALPSEKILALSLPDYRITPKSDIGDVESIAKNLGIELQSIEITKIHNSFLKHLKREKIAEGNLKARIRMSLIYYQSNLHNKIVIGTGDRSEILLGYFTKFGDGGSDILPIGDLYKTQLKILGRHLKVPEKILGKESSPYLWKNQTAKGEIGLSYEKIDMILHLLYDKNKTPEEVGRIIRDSSAIKKVQNMNKKSHHKRNQSPICKILH